MLPSWSTTTLPWHGPITDFPSGPRPQPGTVSKVIRPHPIRTGGVSSAARAGRASPRTRANAKEVERFFTNRAPAGVGWDFRGLVEADTLWKRHAWIDHIQEIHSLTGLPRIRRGPLPRRPPGGAGGSPP